MKYLLGLLILFATSSVFGQKLYTRNDSIPITQDSVTLKAGPHRGNIQWQKSLDNKNWLNLEGGKTSTIKVKSNIEAMYRSAVTDGTCLPVYSDSVAIITADTITKNYVDPIKTGLILISDTTKISSGDYIYTGTSNTNNLEVGRVIIDEKSGGTIRRITESIQKGDTTITHTEQATMEDLFQNTSFKLSTKMVYPTQNLKSASLVEIEKALTDKDGFIHPVEVIYEANDGSKLKSASIYTGSNNAQGGTLYMYKDWSGTKLYDMSGVTFSLPKKNGGIATYSGNVKAYISEGHFTFDPEFKFEYEFDRPQIDWANLKVSKGKLTKFKFYSDRSLIDFKNILTFESNIAYEFGKAWTLWPNIIPPSKFKFIVGGVPIWIDFKIDINCSLTAEFGSGSVSSQGFQNTNNITIGAGYENNEWYEIKNIEKENQVFTSNSGFVNTNVRFEIYPNVQMELYSVIGPHLKIGPYMNYEVALSDSKNWSKSLDLGVDASVGVSADIFGEVIVSYSPGSKNLFNINLWKSPSKLALESGNNQSVETGKALPARIVVKVTNSAGQPVENVQVYFFPMNSGMLQPVVVKTDINGLAQTSWTLSNSSGEQNLKVYLLDGKDREMSGCTLTVAAIATNLSSPVVSTSAITAITQTSATCGGNVTSDGDATVTARGVCWSTIENPTTANSKTTNGSGTGSFTSSLTGLTANTPYYVRAYATNSTGTAYGNQQTFTTSQTTNQLAVTTSAITAISQTSAICGGNVTSDGGLTVTARGICWSTATNPTTANSKTTNGSGTGSFTSSLTGLAANTPYYVRAYATNSTGTAYGNQQTFTTGQTTTQPTVSTDAITAITQTTATCGGNVTSDGGATVTARGVCWNTSGNPTTASSKTSNGSGTGSFSSSLTGLAANTPYYVRAYATNSQGTAYGNQVSFTASPAGNLTGTFTDSRDGKTYKWVQIGTQTWMAENLAYLPAVSPQTVRSYTASHYYVYDYSGTDVATAKALANYTTYGVLYNWPAALAACPLGWHLPSDDEWKQLEVSLGMTQTQANVIGEFRGTDQGIQIKANSYWNNNGNGTNSSGFSGLPGGLCGSGNFGSIGYYGCWWSSTSNGNPSLEYALHRNLYVQENRVYRGGNLTEYGFSVRCIKD